MEAARREAAEKAKEYEGAREQVPSTHWRSIEWFLFSPEVRHGAACQGVSKHAFQSVLLISQHPYLTALHFWVSLLCQRLNLPCSMMTLAGSLNSMFEWSVQALKKMQHAVRG